MRRPRIKLDKSVQKVRHRRLLMMVEFVLFVFLFLLVMFTSPKQGGVLIVFMFTFYWFMFIPVYLFMGHKRKSFLITTGVVGYFVLKTMSVANPLNLVLLISALAVFEIYFEKQR